MSRRLSLPKLSLSQLMTLVGIGAAIFLIASLGQRWLIFREALLERQLEAQRAEADLDRLQILQQKAAEAQNPASLEKAIREELGWTKGHEQSVALVFLEEPAGEAKDHVKALESAQGPPYWVSWLSRFLLP